MRPVLPELLRLKRLKRGGVNDRIPLGSPGHAHIEPFWLLLLPTIMQESGIPTASYRPNEIEQLALEAKLNFIFGAQVYDSVFLGFEILEVVEHELRAWSPSEHCAAVIEVQHSRKVAWIAQSVFKRPVRRINVLLRGMKHDTGEQPSWVRASGRGDTWVNDRCG